jgi:hypothetical protein
MLLNIGHLLFADCHSFALDAADLRRRSSFSGLAMPVLAEAAMMRPATACVPVQVEFKNILPPERAAVVEILRAPMKLDQSLQDVG